MHLRSSSFGSASFEVLNVFFGPSFVFVDLDLAILDITIPGVSFWNQSACNWTLETPMFRNVRNLLLAKAARELLASVNLYVSHLARSVHYFQPVRASVQRDYLSRDVEVGSVDPSGLNVAMVLASLGNLK